MRYVVSFVGIAALAIGYWTDVVLLRSALAPPCIAPAPERSVPRAVGAPVVPPARPRPRAPVSPSDLTLSFDLVEPQVEECYQAHKVPGVAMIDIVVEKSGRVVLARVSGKFEGTPTGICVEDAVRTAWFPRTLDGFTTPHRFELK